MESYWPMIGGKTSALLACCCELGALAGGADEHHRSAFSAFGYSLGLAFQVLDDWLGIWGDTQITGKSAESDLVSGKKTLPVLYGISRDGPFARRWAQGGIHPEEVSGLARMLEEEGAYTSTLETASRLTEEAMDALQKATGEPVSTCASDASQALLDISHALLQRRR
jgi:geranylgeranyl diphosphate synthase type I